MNSLINNIKNFFSSAPVNDSCELQHLKGKEKNTKGLNAPEPRAQHSASTQFFPTSFFARFSLPLPSFLRGSRANTSFSSQVSNALNKLAGASESKDPKEVIDSLITLQKLQRVDAGQFDKALNMHLLMKSKHKVRRNPIQAANHIRSLSEANPVNFQGFRHIQSDESLNQFHANLMNRLEEQYTKAFGND